MKNLNNKLLVKKSDLVLYKLTYNEEESEYVFGVLSEKDEKRIMLLSKNLIMNNIKEDDLFTFTYDRIVGCYDDIVPTKSKNINLFFEFLAEDKEQQLKDRFKYINVSKETNNIEKRFVKTNHNLPDKIGDYISLKDIKKFEKYINKYLFAKEEQKEKYEIFEKNF